MTVYDVVTAAHELIVLLQRLDPFEATATAADVALHPDAYVRHALAAALVVPFPLVGDDFVIDLLTNDADYGVASAARRAAIARGVTVLQRESRRLSSQHL